MGGNSDAPNEKATPEIARLRGIARELRRRRPDSLRRAARARAIAPLTARRDVFVTTRRGTSPFGITPVEAMALRHAGDRRGRVGGIRHSVADGITGFLVAPRDPAALAARLDQLRRDPALCSPDGRSGH